MKNSSRNIGKERIVNEEMEREAEFLEMDPKVILRLIDLLFLERDEGRDIPS